MRYFFDTIENGERTSDGDGVHFTSDEVAMAQAAIFLAEVAAEMIPSAGFRSLGVEVRREDGELVTAIGLSFDRAS